MALHPYFGRRYLRNFVVGSAALLFFAALPALASVSYCDSVAGNLVANCGFESGNFNGWTQSGNTGYTSVSPAYVHTGSVSLDGGTTELYSVTNIPAQPFTRYTFNFTATGSTSLQFSFRNDHSTFALDDIVVTPAVSPVPEPASVVLLLSLLAIAGIVLRRRIARRPAN